MTLSKANITKFRRVATQANAAFVTVAIDRSKWAPEEVRTGRPAYAALVTGAQWSKLKSYAKRRLSQENRRFRKLRQAQSIVTESINAVDALLATPERVPPTLTSMSSWTKVRQAIKEKYGTTAARRKKAEAALRTIEQLNGRRALEDRRHLLETRTEDLDRDARRCLSAIAAARFAQMIAALNTSLTAQKASMPPNKHAATSKALTELHRATVAGDWQAAGAQGTALAAAGLHSALQSIHALATDAARKSATSQLQRAEEFRNAFEVMTIGMWANWVSGWPPSLRTLLEWQGAAKALRMSKKRTWPAGTLVKGLVESVKISHVAKKAVSVALVRAGKKVKTVGIAHIKLDSSGIVAGAHIVARCRPAAKVDWYRDSPVYQLKQFQTSEAASKYWYDWLVLRGNGLFMSRPHEFAASWTLQRAGDGAGNPLRYGVWTGPSTFQRKPYGSL